MKNTGVADHLIRQLNGHGLNARPLVVLPRLGPDGDYGVDFGVEIRARGERWFLLAEVKHSAPQPADIATLRRVASQIHREHPNRVLLVVAPRLLARHRKALRDAGVSHADLCGVAYISAPGLLVNVERVEETASEIEIPSPGAAAVPNVFSDRATLVIRAVAESAPQPIRASRISALTEISNAWVSNVAAELTEREYIARTPKGLVLGDRARLLIDWSHAYEWKQNSIRRYQVDATKDEILEKLRLTHRHESGHGSDYFLTLHSGAAFYAPHVESEVVTLYAPGAAMAPMIAWASEALFGVPTTSGGNLQLVAPFYELSFSYGAQQREGQHVVSLLQLFLDLARYPLRGPEAAAMLIRNGLGNRLGLSPEESRRLVGELA